MINDVLDFSMIEADGLHLENTDFHLATVLEKVAKSATLLAQGKDLTICFNEHDAPAWLHGDPTRLRQALLHYTSNAVKFTEHGSISLDAHLLRESDGELLLRFDVQDSGTGIANDKLGLLFQAFEQADSSTTRHYGGTGLGLSITRRLVQLMGGEVGVQSRPGHGSTFWFTVRMQRGHGKIPIRRGDTEWGQLLPQQPDDDALLPVTAEAVVAPTDLQDVSAMLDKLEQLLTHNDTDAVALFTSHADALQSLLGAPGETLALQITQFAFEPALQTLRSWRQDHPIAKR
jgi:hypothetical protein